MGVIKGDARSLHDGSLQNQACLLGAILCKVYHHENFDLDRSTFAPKLPKEDDEGTGPGALPNFPIPKQGAKKL